MYWQVFTYDTKISEGEFDVWLETLLRNLHAEEVQLLANQKVLVRYPEERGDYDKYGNYL